MTNRWTVAALWLFLFGSFALLSPPLLDGADALHAEIAREMLVRGDPVALYANGMPCPGKAPLMYWSMAGSMRVCGVGAAQARLPLAISVLLLALLVEAFARRAFQSNRAGLYAAVSLLLSPVLFLATRILEPDAVSCLWVTLAVFCLWRAGSAPQERTGDAPVLPCLGFAAACALNVLTVGPKGLLLPLGTMLLYLLLTRGAQGAVRRMVGFHPVVSSVVFLMILLPWYVLASEASSTKSAPAFLHIARWIPWVLHGWRSDTTFSPSPFVLLAGLLPWCAFLPLALGSVPWRKSLRSLNEQQRLLLLLAIAALLPILFMPFAALRTSYAVAALPFLCTLVARWLDREATGVEAMTVPPQLGQAGVRVAVGLLVAGKVTALLCVVLFLRTEPPSPHADLAALLHHAPGTPLRHLPGTAAWGAFRGPLLIVGAALFMGTLLNWQLRRSYRPHLGNVALAAATLVCLTEAHVALNTLAPVLSSQPLAAALTPMLRPGNRIVIDGQYEEAATLGFYLQRDNFHTLKISDSGDVPTAYETAEFLRKQWDGPERIFLWTDPTKLPALPTKAYIVAEGGGKQIVSNKAGPY